MPIEFVLGNPVRSTKRDALREGAFSVLSRKGLAATQRILVENLPKEIKGRVLTGLDTEGSCAMVAMSLYGKDQVDFFHSDIYVAEKVKTTLSQNGFSTDCVQLSADLPHLPALGVHDFIPDAYGLVAIPLPKHGEQAFARELVEQAHAVLRPAGVFLTATDNRSGLWLSKLVREVFGDASLVKQPQHGGCLIAARRRRPQAAVRDHSHAAEIDLRGTKVAIATRPGIFGHRRLDAGTAALLDVARVAQGQSIADIGCGPGTIGIYLGKVTGGRVLLADSSIRATQVAAENARRNKIEAEVINASDLLAYRGEPFDQVFCNPPYFSNFRIAESFVLSGKHVLKPGGKFWLVAKNADAHAAIAAEILADVQVQDRNGYGIITGFAPLS